MSSPDLYLTADVCPLVVFDKVANSGNVTFFSRTGAHTVDECKKAWEAINEEIFIISGIPSQKKEQLNEKINAFTALYEGLIEGDLVQRSMGKHLLISLTSSEGSAAKADIWRVCAMLSQKHKIHLNPNTLTVREYITWLTL